MRHQIIMILLAIQFIFLTSLALGQQRPDAPAYAQRGPYPVGTQTYTLEDSERPLRATIWYPALNPDNQEEAASYNLAMMFNVEGSALKDAAPDIEDGPYPLIVFSHGSGSSRVLSLYYTEHLASYGFVVLAVDHLGDTSAEMVLGAQQIIENYAYRPQDITRLIAFAETLNDSEGDLANLIDMGNIGVSGHSFGGYTALTMAGGRLDFEKLATWCAENRESSLPYNVCFLLDHQQTIADLRGLDTIPQGAWPPVSDSRIKAVAVLAPWNGPILDVTDIQASTMVIVGTHDEVTPAERDAFLIFDQLNVSEKHLVTFNYANHYIYIDKCPDLLLQFDSFEFCSDAVWDMDRAHDIINHMTTAFFLTNLQGDDAAATALEPDAVHFTGVDYR